MARTTLADIAQAADVQVGNLYYYFKTKDDIVAAIVRTHADQLAAMRRHRRPNSRLKASYVGLPSGANYSPATDAGTARWARSWPSRPKEPTHWPRN